jgi:O-acetyl-ADP-ribose deacetylase (regulator of RNase III)
MDATIELIQADITKIKVDAIVNAANTSLLGGGGVDGAIHRAGGKEILEQCIGIKDKQGGCPVGEAVITTGGKLPAKYVIHAVGPVWSKNNPNAERLLTNAYRHSLELAVANGVKTIAFPNISTGVYQFPKIRAAEIAINAIDEFLSTDFQLEKVVLVCFDSENYAIYKNLIYRELILR